LKWEDCVKKDLKTLEMEGSCREQSQMARFVFSGMVLKAETKKEKEDKY
jgi:hypothetical protein